MTMTNSEEIQASRRRAVVEQCLRREMASDAAFPSAEEDVVEGGALDSMAWVSFVRCVEDATGVRDFGERMMDQPRSLRTMLAVLESSQGREEKTATPVSAPRPATATGIAGWAHAVGSCVVEAATVEREFHLPVGKIRKGAGIETVARLAREEDEVSFCAAVCDTALARAGWDIGEVDWLIATSETHSRFPSLGASLHARLLAGETCGVLDVGGACVGLLNSLSAAQALLIAGRARRVLVVSGDVHSRVLTPGRVKGEFGGLFGDGASAFLLRAAEGGEAEALFRLGEFHFGCSSIYASALRIGLTPDQGIALTFEGEALARAAVEQMERVIEDVELRSGKNRTDASAFVIHQPNPRLVKLLARQAGIPVEKIPVVAKTCGNLGSSTCGVALSMALSELSAKTVDQRGPIFLAAVGPGMLWGGGVLY